MFGMASRLESLRKLVDLLGVIAHLFHNGIIHLVRLTGVAFPLIRLAEIDMQV